MFSWLCFVNSTVVKIYGLSVPEKLAGKRRSSMKKEYDLKKLKKRSSVPKSSREAAKVAISIRLDGGDLSELRTESERLGIPYQTLIGSVLHRYVSGELVDRAAPELRKLLKDVS
jgi:predicted DNA binding CopG/RHH family protein